jgi:predicted regulator of Ras-like GTPase activity (Roadblock/LC7/MglB family)
MKSKLAKFTAVALAMAMTFSTSAFAADDTATNTVLSASGQQTITTSFGVYSPTITVSVPLKADIQVNPLYDSSATGVKKFTVASKDLVVLNASVDTDADAAIPVNVAVSAAITKTGDDVVTEFNTFTGDLKSSKKRINLNLTQADSVTGTAVAKNSDGSAGTATFIDATNNKRLDLSKWTPGTGTYGASPTNTTAITNYGSLLSVDIAGPSTTDTTTGATFTSDATKVTPKDAAFAVTGVANASADWKADDIAVSLVYNIKASSPLSISTPAIATAPTFTQGSSTDLTITVPNVGEAKYVAMALHNYDTDITGVYKDFVLGDDDATVKYAANATTPTQTDLTITIPKDSGVLEFLAGTDYSKKPQDLVIALNDGRYVVSTLTVTAKS